MQGILIYRSSNRKASHALPRLLNLIIYHSEGAAPLSSLGTNIRAAKILLAKIPKPLLKSDSLGTQSRKQYTFQSLELCFRLREGNVEGEV